MKTGRVYHCSVSGLFLAACILALAAGSSSADEPNGVVRIEGKHIERVVFHSLPQELIKRTFTDPNETVRLPVGRYYVREMFLQGGYRFRLWGAWRDAEVVVSEGRQTVLKMGGPLTQKVTVNRQGNRLIMDYELLGIGGEQYFNYSGSRDEPKFTVYQGKAKVGSGAFAYG